MFSDCCELKWKVFPPSSTELFLWRLTDWTKFANQLYCIFTQHCIWNRKQNAKMLWWWRTTVITVIYGWMVYSCIVGVRPGSRVVVIPVFCIVIYPFQCRYRPFDHLTFIRSESQQKKWQFGGKEDWLLLVSICLATELYLCIFIIFAWRKYSTFVIQITKVVIIPVNVTFSQTWWALWTFLVNTVFTYRRSVRCK